MRNAKKKINASCVGCCPEAEEARRIGLSRIGEINFPSKWEQGELCLSFLKSEGCGFSLEIHGNDAVIRAGITREFIAGIGCLLSSLRTASDGLVRLVDGIYKEISENPIGVHYMPGHFGNAFEVAWPGEMERYLDDLALWGASGYGDWFDPNDMPDPYAPHVYCSTSMTLWQRKKEFLRTAKRLGLETVLFVAHNVGFTDQMRPEWTGVRSHAHRVQGQVLCPSIPEARRVCLQNHENLFRDLAESRVVVDRLIYGPYDDGGCACEKCQPYYPTFLKMAEEIHGIARRHFSQVAMDLCGWWVTDEEMRLIREFVAGPAREWFHGFQFSATYGVFELPDVRTVLGDLPFSAFFHIGFSHDRRDVYYKTGIHSASRRIQSVIKSFAAQQCLGFNTYNESFGDHYNQFLCSRLGRIPGADPRMLTEDYCRQMYALSGKDLRTAADVLLDMEDLDESKAEKWKTALGRIRPRVHTPPRQQWAFEHFRIKAGLMALDHAIGTGDGWKTQEDIAPVLPLIRRRFALQETLWRDVYGLGTLRHCFIPLCMSAAWHPNYLKIYPEDNGNIRPGSAVSKNA
ncbi:MAG: hypothetical protein WC637_00655 [Victivallales bacterium]|jgi:hypothetical protein